MDASIARPWAEATGMTDQVKAPVQLANAAGLGATTANRAMSAIPPGEWSLEARPAVNVVATLTKAAVAGVRHVARTITGVLASGTGLAAAAQVDLFLRDGATGVGAIIWSTRFSIPNVLGQANGPFSIPVNIPGTAGNAMTLEFSAAGGAGTFEGVALTGTEAT